MAAARGTIAAECSVADLACSISSEVGGLKSSDIDGSAGARAAHSEQPSFSPGFSQRAPAVSTTVSVAFAPTADHSCLATVSAPAPVHGPANVLRRLPKQRSDVSDGIVQSAPVLARAPLAHEALPEPARYTSRGFRPTVEALESLASDRPSPPSEAFVASSVVSAPSSAPTFTTDQLAARTPRNGHQALRGPDSEYWVPGIMKDFAIIRDNECIINVADKRPPGPAPPCVEQGFKIKHRSDTPIAADNFLFLHDAIEMATSLFVDDGALACPSLQHAEQVLGGAGLGRTRKITRGPLRSTLGIDFDVSYSENRRLVFMSQRAFAVTILP